MCNWSEYNSSLWSTVDPDSEWLLHVMTPHFPTKKASETGLLLPLPLSSPTALWADHNIPLNLCQTNWTFSLLTGVKKNLIWWKTDWFAKSMSALLSDLSRRSRRSERELAKAAHLYCYSRLYKIQNMFLQSDRHGLTLKSTIKIDPQTCLSVSQIRISDFWL